MDRDLEKPELQEVETAATVLADEDDITMAPEKKVVGTVQLLVHNETVLIPTPSPDPKGGNVSVQISLLETDKPDPLNLPTWRKWAILILLGAYSSTSVLLASGMGAIFTAVEQAYPGQEARATDLLTYPTLFMGIGNLIAMPLALTIGRRPVFIVTLIILVVSGIGCAFSKSLSGHIAGRDIMSLAAGQSEALCPMIIQEIHFLHERGRKLSWFAAIQSIGTAAFFIATTFLVSAGGWRWWYGVFTIINGTILVLSFFLVCETMYDRPEDATQGAVHLDFNKQGELDKQGDVHKVVRITTAHGNILEPERYGPRTWKHDLQLFSIQPKWSELPKFYLQILQGLCVPSMFWLLLLNGAFLGLYVFQASTFATVLVTPPYSISFNNLGFIFSGQLVDCLIFLPLLGYGTDLVIKGMSKFHNGLYEPEFRLIILAIPAVVGVICAVLYGQAAQFPDKYSWASIAVTYNAIYFAFLGANIVGLTYAIDSFPLRAGSLLVLICAGRGFISFGLSYSTLPAIKAIGYDGTMNAEAIVSGVLAAVGIPMYFLGSRIRRLAQRWFNMGGEKE